MGLAEIEAAVLEVVLVALEECELDPPDRVFRYLTTPPVDCCTDPGTLTLHSDLGYSTTADVPQRVTPQTNSPFQSAADLKLRWWTCWPESNPTPTPAVMDAATVRVLAELDCIWFGLAKAICPSGALAACGKFVLVDTRPIRPGGGCAGFEISLKVRWTR